MTAPNFVLPVTGTDPKLVTKTMFEEAINAGFQELYDEVSAISTGLSPAGAWSAASGSFPAGAARGTYYIVSTAGTTGGQTFAVGDWLIPLVNLPSTSTYAGNWTRGDYSKIVPPGVPKRRFASITAFLADVTLGSTIPVSNGDEIDAAGDRYTVVSSGEDVTTAGGVKLKVVERAAASPYVARSFNLDPSNTGSANHAALQLALDRLSTSRGGKVTVQRGSYDIASDVTTLDGCGIGGASPGLVYGSIGTRLNFADGKGVVIAGSGGGLSNLELLTTGTSLVPLIRFTGASRYWNHFKGLVVNGGAVEQIDTNLSVAGVFEDILLINGLQGRAGFVGRRGALLARGADNFFVRVEANATSGFSAITGTGVAGAIVVEGANNFFTDCIAELSDFGLLLNSGSHHRFSNLRCDLNWGHGLILNNGNGIFSGVDCINNGNGGAADTYCGVISIGNPGGAIRNLRVNNFDKPRLLYAVDMNASGNSGGDFSIDLVTAINCLNAVRTEAFNPVTVTLAANKASRQTVSGTSLNVNGVSKFILSASSPVSIETFQGGYLGQEVEVYSESTNITLAINAGAADPKLFLQSGANYNFPGGGAVKRFKLMPRGGSPARWIEI